MHNPPGTAATARLWLIAGTGEGPVLATRLLDRGWRIQVSLVSSAAALAYRSHPNLDLRVGAIEAKAGISRELALSREGGGGFQWVIDASHPFACQISLAVNKACQAAGQPMLRLHRPPLPTGTARVLKGLSDLQHCELEAARLLMAIGSRRMGEAMASTPRALHHARILPHALALQQAMAAGLPPERVACLRPGGDMAIERALCRRWGITTVLCRQSGGVTEGGWSSICSELGLRLLLLERPDEALAAPTLTIDQLLERVGWP
jgi:precorrin-6A/cobalt-precorrin-6A reductase